MRVALASCLHKPEPDPDEAPLVLALGERGVLAEVVAWDDAGADWPAFDLVVLRSTWNYTEQPRAFAQWLDAVGHTTRLLNPPAIAKANLDKRYLLDLAARGVAVVPTLVFERHHRVDLPAELSVRGWSDVVIKPVVGAASRGTRHFAEGSGRAARAFLEAALTQRDMMVQPYQSQVETVGERALVWIAGELHHAVRKSPRFEGEHESVSEALPVAADERALAEQALAPYRDELLYARVDVVRATDGAPQVMELELVEPSLFLVQNPAALQAMAAAIVERAQKSG